MTRHEKAIRPAHVVGIVVAGCLIATMVWLIPGMQQDGNPKATPVPTDGSAPVKDPITSDPLNPAPEQSDPPELTATKEGIRKSVARFVALYYGRTPAVYAGDEGLAQRRFERQLEALVTPGFMAPQNLPRLVDDTFAAQVAEGRRFDAVVMEKSVSGHFYDRVTVDQVMTVIRRDTTGPKPRPVEFISVDIELVLVDGEWRVSALEERDQM